MTRFEANKSIENIYKINKPDNHKYQKEITNRETKQTRIKQLWLNQVDRIAKMWNMSQEQRDRDRLSTPKR